MTPAEVCQQGSKRKLAAHMQCFQASVIQNILAIFFNCLKSFLEDIGMKFRTLILCIGISIAFSGPLLAQSSSEEISSEEMMGSRSQPFPFTHAPLRDIVLLFEALGPVNGRTQYEVKLTSNSNIQPFEFNRKSRAYKKYAANNLKRIDRSPDGSIFLDLGSFPMVIEGYNFKLQSYVFCIPYVKYVVGWGGTEDEGLYVTSSNTSSLLQLTAQDYHNKSRPGRVYSGGKDKVRCRGDSKKMLPKRFSNGRLGGRGSVTLTVPMPEQKGEELYYLVNPKGNSSPKLVSANVTCKAKGGYCVLVGFKAIVGGSGNPFTEISWSRFRNFEINKIPSADD